MKKRERRFQKLGADKWRKYRHWQATIYYHDGEKFARVYVQKEKAERFAARQRKSPVVKSARVTEVDK